MRQLQWQERFDIGVDIVDQAHKRLFAIVDKIMELYVERHESKFACVEGIKYFKAYALKHFAEEEAYMREIHYPGYLVHKRLHDRMKRETLPALEEALYASDFSTEAVQRFIGVCTGWLTGHIIIEDRAIIGGQTNELIPMPLDDELAVIHALIVSPLQKILGCTVQFIGTFSTKDEILNAQYYQLTYSAPPQKQLRVILVMGEPLLLRAAGLMFGIDFYEKNEIVCFALQEIAQNLIQRAAISFGDQPDEYQLEHGQFLDHAQFSEIFKAQPPQYSLLFHVGQECFALCIDQALKPDPPIS